MHGSPRPGLHNGAGRRLSKGLKRLWACARNRTPSNVRCSAAAQDRVRRRHGRIPGQAIAVPQLHQGATSGTRLESHGRTDTASRLEPARSAPVPAACARDVCSRKGWDDPAEEHHTLWRGPSEPAGTSRGPRPGKQISREAGHRVMGLQGNRHLSDPPFPPFPLPPRPREWAGARPGE